MNTGRLLYTKDSKKKQCELVRDNPTDYVLIQEVWSIRDAHMIPNLPSQYLFYLKCCHRDSCPHPICQQLSKETHWYHGGPSLDYLPLPVPDPKRRLGNSSCTQCAKFNLLWSLS